MRRTGVAIAIHNSFKNPFCEKASEEFKNCLAIFEIFFDGAHRCSAKKHHFSLCVSIDLTAWIV
jgi:hypothetical protein